MTVCAGLLVKDEADIIETTIRHMLTQVDEVVVCDNLSTDGTSEILLRLREELGILVQADEEVGYYQATKTTALAQEARQRGHGWFIPVDADELWFASDGRRIGDFLDGVPLDAMFVKAAIYNHVATDADPADEPNPVRRLCWRQREPLAYQWWKVACRTRPDLEIAMGNHAARTHGPGREETGLIIHHFPYRSAEQFVRKAENGLAAYRAAPDLMNAGYGAHWKVYGETVEQGGPEAGEAWFYDAFFIHDPDRDPSLVFDPAPVPASVVPLPNQTGVWQPPSEGGTTA